MPIVVLFLIFAGALIIAVLYPHLRLLAVAVVALFSALLAAYFLTSDGDGSARADRIPPDEVMLSELDFTDDQRLGKLSGVVENRSETWRLRGFDLQLSLMTCVDADAPETCKIFAEENGLSRVDIPPGQVRRFEVPFPITGQSVPGEDLVWKVRVTATKATP